MHYIYSLYKEVILIAYIEDDGNPWEKQNFPIFLLSKGKTKHVYRWIFVRINGNWYVQCQDVYGHDIGKCK